ncbi:MAG: exonuclease SbcCD subunit D C-terminal domain-containing protein [Chitinophagaceae bacterium]|nr:exonuclease SbcCD subunit D C-terminal domain-containing protein [Chitinophagaceae bacterium]
MKILHTADWHIGQLFYEYDRSWEHQQFLEWLINTLEEEAVDVMLLSGDVFDLSNPSAASIRQFYSFLNRATGRCPSLEIVVTAGNHDSAARLESPKPLLESSNIHIVGLVERDSEGNIDYEKLIIPLHDAHGEVKAWCLAVPFLRSGDYPAILEVENPYAAGVAHFYEELYQRALIKKRPGQAVIAMGHLHTQQANVTDMDNQERLIMGGVECIGADAFPSEISYVALGHIHKAQRIGGRENVRYSGSPLPMSFSEINYRHQVILFELEGETITKLDTIQVPVSVPLLRVPATHSRLTEVLSALQQLPDTNGQEEPALYLEVCVLSEGPDPGLGHRVQQALAGKYVRLAKIDVRYAETLVANANSQGTSPNLLHELNPTDVFTRVFQAKYNNPVPEELANLFREVAAEVTQNE